MFENYVDTNLDFLNTLSSNYHGTITTKIKITNAHQNFDSRAKLKIEDFDLFKLGKNQIL